MFTRTVLAAALIFPAFAGLPSAPKTTAPAPVIVPADSMVNFVCPLHRIIKLGGGVCLYELQVCDLDFFVWADLPCPTPEVGCPCDDPAALVEMPKVAGQRARVWAGASDFKGHAAMPNAYIADAPTPLELNDRYELLADFPVRVGEKPFRVLSILKTGTNERCDVGFEMVGVDPATTRQYPTAQPRAVFGNAMQAAVRVDGKERVFLLKTVGKSLVREIATDKPLAPVPDNSVPPAK